jgi:cephalosporin hydroxylase
MDQELLDKFHLAYYNSRIYTTTTWRGHNVQKFSTDLINYQEIIFDTRPDVIIECGTAEGGSAVFFGDMLHLLGHGRVFSIDNAARATPEHPNVVYLEADSGDDNSSAVIELTYARLAHHKIMVVLDSAHDKPHVLRELDVWAPFVTPGCYLVVEDTNLNGHPVPGWDAGGPMEALEEWLPNHPEFEIDKSREKFLLTTQPNGFLRRKQA